MGQNWQCNKWHRLNPYPFAENIELKKRETRVFTIESAYFPHSNFCRVIDVDWESKEDVPVCISSKRSKYSTDKDGFPVFDEMRICLFNVSNERKAIVNLYVFEEMRDSPSTNNEIAISKKEDIDFE
ncbi:hypothetical protein [Bacillus mycoides]|uniref:hypothetical protein n=1 Tax=Bacillus mycoides TaxID=1405 RepID=UPI003D64DBF9